MKLVIAAFLSLVTLSAHDIITTKLTFTRDISRIFVRRCQACHGSDASIPLTTYEQARPWAVSIKEQVLSRQMPPWGAVKGFGNLSPDNGLSQEEIMIIAAWVIGGAPKGIPIPPSNFEPPLKFPPLKDSLIVSNKCKISQPLKLAGIRPIATSAVDSARIVATFPDGHIEPLLWLFHYNPAAPQTFRFRDTIALPSGALIESGAPLQFALEVR